MKVLLTQSNHKLRDRLKLYLDNLPLVVDIEEASSLIDLKDKLLIDSTIDIVVASHEGSSLKGMEISNFILENHKADLLINSDEDLEQTSDYQSFSRLEERSHLITNNTNCESFHNLVLDILKRRRNLNYSYEKEYYRKVRLSYFLRFNRVLCDVYIKLGEDKYVKVFTENDLYTRHDLQKYRGKGVKYLYIQDEDYESFGSSLAVTPFLIESKNLPFDQIEDAVINTLDIVHEMVRESGITDEVINLVDYTTYQIESSLSQDKVLDKLLSSLRERRDYLLDHSYMIAYFSNSICSYMDWDSEEIRAKLTYAAVLQDVFLTDPKKALTINLELPDMTNYTSKEISEYQEHPLKIVKLIKENKKIPLNVDDILLSHHERPEGNGYPRGLSYHRVSPPSAVFILAHVFVDELYRIEFDLSRISECLKIVEKRFSKGVYEKPLEGLLKFFE